MKTFLRNSLRFKNIPFLLTAIILPLTPLKLPAIAIINSFMLTAVISGPAIQAISSRQRHGQPIRELGPKSHLTTKKNTPTMGGLIVIACGVLSTIAFNGLGNILAPIVGVLGFGAIGFADDFVKIKFNNSSGLRGKAKLLLEIVMAFVFSLLIYSYNPGVTQIFIPFIGALNLGVLFLPLSILTIISAANAFNLTDGLDGLAISQYIVITGFLLINLLGLGAYSWISELPGALSLALMLSSFLGAALSFWYWNAYPAKIFMGDVGSLGLGALIGIVFVMSGLEIVLIGAGIILVIETLSVVIQVVYFKRTGGKRIFLMTPIHHHFEKKGMHETRITLGALFIALLINMVLML